MRFFIKENEYTIVTEDINLIKEFTIKKLPIIEGHEIITEFIAWYGHRDKNTDEFVGGARYETQEIGLDLKHVALYD